jgi:hypothetical protein
MGIRAVSRIFLLGPGGGQRAKPESYGEYRRCEAEGGRSGGLPPENFENLDALRGVFPPSQKLKDILVPQNAYFG